MAKKSFLDASSFQKNIESICSTLNERAEAFQRLVVSEVASHFQEALKQRAPTDADLPADYKNELEVVRVGGREASYGVVYRGRGTPGKQFAPETTVLYVQLLNAKDRSPEAKLFAALSRFQPFTMDTMPLEVPRSTAFVVARTVTKAEATLIRKRAVGNKSKIARVIEKDGQGVVSKKAFDANSALLFNDLAFQVLRKELGIGLSRKPHWRPALTFVASDEGFLKKMMQSKESVRLWNDPTYTGWQKAGMLDTVPEKSVKDLDDFQKKIVTK